MGARSCPMNNTPSRETTTDDTNAPGGRSIDKSPTHFRVRERAWAVYAALFIFFFFCGCTGAQVK